MTLAGFILAVLPYFAGLIFLSLLIDAIFARKGKGKGKPAKPAATPSTTVAVRPAERLYTADEVVAMAEEFHARKEAERPSRVQFVDAETGEVWED